MNGHFYFEIQADDTQRAAGLYKGVFGWTFEQVYGLPVEYWRIETGGTRGGLLKRPAQPPPPQCGTNAFVVSIEVENFDETARKILSLGGKLPFQNLPFRVRAGKGILSTPKAILLV